MTDELSSHIETVDFDDLRFAHLGKPPFDPDGPMNGEDPAEFKAKRERLRLEFEHKSQHDVLNAYFLRADVPVVASYH